MDLINTAIHRAARNAASIALADDGVGVSSIQIYTVAGGELLGVRRLQRPCGVLEGARIRLQVAAEADLATVSGAAGWAEWCDGDGTAISAGHITDIEGNYTTDSGAVELHPDGPGVWRLTSTDGSPGTIVRAGGVIDLTAALIG